MLLRDNIYRAIRHSILTCEYGPGQDLREQVLAEFYHVSRSPIRDSLLRLEHENLVTVLPRQGYRVKDVCPADVEEIYGLRLVIEPACAAGAARRDGAAVSTLDAFRDYADDGSVFGSFGEYNQAFHNAVSSLSGNKRLTAVAHDLVAQFDRLVRIIFLDDQTVRTKPAAREHDLMIAAIQAHDADTAARLAYEHVDGARTRALTILRGRGTPSGKLNGRMAVNGHNRTSHTFSPRK